MINLILHQLKRYGARLNKIPTCLNRVPFALTELGPGSPGSVADNTGGKGRKISFRKTTEPWVARVRHIQIDFTHLKVCNAAGRAAAAADTIFIHLVAGLEGVGGSDPRRGGRDEGGRNQHW